MHQKAEFVAYILYKDKQQIHFSYHLSLSFNLGGWKLLFVIKKRALEERREHLKSCDPTQEFDK